MRRFILPVTLAVILSATGSSAQSYRLKSFSHGYIQSGVYTMSDSNTYYYSYGRGSSNVEVLQNFNSTNLGNPEPVGAILYDSAIYQLQSLQTSPFERHVQSFDMLNRPVTNETQRYVYPSGLTNFRRYSSSYYGTTANVQKITEEAGSPSGTSWVVLATDTFEYDASNNLIFHLLKQMQGSTLVNSTQVSSTYVGGLLSVVQSDYWSTSLNAWQMDGRWDYYYNGSNGLDKSVYLSFNQRTTDSFSSTGLQVSTLRESRPTAMSPFSPRFRDTFIYAGTQLTEKITLELISGNWVNFWKYQYLYNGTQLTDLISYQDIGGNWVPFEKYVYAQSGSTSHTYHMYWDGGLNVYDTTFDQVKAFNPGGLLTSFEQYNYNGSTPTQPDSMFRLYYESYNPLEVNSVYAAQPVLKVYPVPANHLLHFELVADKEGNMITSLYDMQGRLIRQSAGYTGKVGRHSIAVADLPSGEYILNVRLGDKVFHQRFSVMH